MSVWGLQWECCRGQLGDQMSSLRRAMFHAGAALAAALLVAAVAVPAQAAPAGPSAPHAPDRSMAVSSAEEATTQAADVPVPYPVKTWIGGDGASLFYYANTSSPGPWHIVLYDSLGEYITSAPVEAQTEKWFGLPRGGWVYIYLWNENSDDYAFVDAFDLHMIIERVAGTSRFETSAAISEDAFRRGVGVAYIANGLNFPDALSGAAAAGYLGGPVLLTRPDVLPDAIKAELERLHAQRIVVLGSTSAVSDAVKMELTGYTDGSVTRIGGPSRFETSALISQDAFDPGVPVAYVANGLNFPDALSGAAAAGHLGGPVLLTQATALPAAIAAELDRLDPAKIVVLGSTGVVSSAVQAQLTAYTAGPVERQSGPSRFETSAAISAAAFEPGVPVAYIANAFNFPDALSGAAAAGMLGGPILLSRADHLEDAIKTELTRLKPEKIVVLGSPAVMSRALVAGEITGYLTAAQPRAGGIYQFGNNAFAGPGIQNLSITGNNVSVTVNFDYVHPAGQFTPVYVGIYPGTPAEVPYSDLGAIGSYGLNDDWSAWMFMPDGVQSGHASQSFSIHDDGPLTVMLFGTIPGGDEGTIFLAGRDLAAP